ncbi:MAG: hypothetical protein ACLFPX_01740 [Candidatus Omnitrophota bacterium]
MKFFIYIAVILAWLTIPVSVQAQLLLEQGKVKKIVQPGETVVGTFSVHNLGQKAINADIYLEDFEYKPPFTGEKNFMRAGTAERSNAEWINFYPSEITLPPSSADTIRYTINVPEDARGGYYSVMFFEAAGGSPDQLDSTGLLIIARVGTLFFVETEDRLKKIEVTDVSLSDEQLVTRVKNDGNVVLVVSSVYFVLDENGVPVSRGKADSRYLGIGDAVDIPFSLPDDLDQGRYTAVITYDMEEGDAAVLEAELRKTSAGTLEVVDYTQ